MLPDLELRVNYHYYPTSEETVRKCLSLLPQDLNPKSILDPGSGDGIWGQVARSLWKDATIDGVEIRNVPSQKDYDTWIPADFSAIDLGQKYDLVIGNPPFKHAETFCKISLNLLNPQGCLLFLLPLSFLESQSRQQFFRDYPPTEVYVFSKRPSFSGDGKTDSRPYMVGLWDRTRVGDTTVRWI